MHGLHSVLLPTQTTVAVCCASAFCDHRCVFMRVSTRSRAVSVHGVYAGGKCDPSQDGAVTQLPDWAQPCTVISSHLPLFYDRQLVEGPSNYLQGKNTALPLHTPKTTYVWVEGRISTSSPGRSFINWIFCHYSPGTLETEPRRWWRVSVQICVEIMSSCRLKIRMSPLPEMIHSSVPLDHNHLIFI